MASMNNQEPTTPGSSASAPERKSSLTRAYHKIKHSMSRKGSSLQAMASKSSPDAAIEESPLPTANTDELAPEVPARLVHINW
jgi:hypothetical protein